MNFLKPSSLLVVSAAVLAGCAVGPTYHRPDTKPAETFRGQTAAETQSLADLDWWDIYQDPALTALIRATLTDGFDTRIAATRVEQGAGPRDADNGPAVSLRRLHPARGSAAVTRSSAIRTRRFRARPARPSRPSFQPRGSPTSGAGCVAWMRSRATSTLQTDEARKGVVLSLVTEVASDYFMLLELDRELAIAPRRLGFLRREPEAVQTGAWKAERPRGWRRPVPTRPRPRKPPGSRPWSARSR